MKAKVIEKLSAVVCALCLTAGVMGGVVVARGEEVPEPTPAEETPEAVQAPEQDRSYEETDVYWLSHFIYAAAGDFSIETKTAVGSVVLNRIQDEAFAGQDSVYDVIFAKNQFDVVINGMIYMEPDDASVTAAKQALEGEDAACGAAYFAAEAPSGADVTVQLDGLVFYR